jgi:hypothetical protein
MRLRLRAERAVLLNALLKVQPIQASAQTTNAAALISGRMRYHPKPTLCVLSIVAVFSLLEPGPFFIATTFPQIPSYALRRTVSRFLTPVRGLRQRIQWCFLKARDSTASSSES